jgi:hypothetical protein
MTTRDFLARASLPTAPPHFVRIALAVVIALVVVAAWATRAAADAPTLFKWSYGDGGDGGPKLDEPIVTDRPDFTEASSCVGRGVFQLESGYTYTDDRDANGSTHSHAFPEATFRIGMFADWFELRIVWNYEVVTQTQFGVSRATQSGADDLVLGAKWGLTGQAGILPEMALITRSTVPSGAGAFSANEMLPGAAWCNGWKINDWLETGTLTSADRAIDDVTGDPYLQLAQSWTFNYRLTEPLHAYTEWYVIATDGADTNHTQNYADGGFTYLVNNDVQLDIRAGVGLNEAADDYFVGSGLSFRR